MKGQTDIGLRVGCDSFYIKQKLSEFQRFAEEFFKCKFVKFLLMVSTIGLHIKVAELNTPSDGKGITGIPSAVFYEMGNKPKKKRKFT